MAKILYADTKDQRDGYVQFLQDAGHEVHEVGYVEGVAIEMAKQGFDLVIMDPLMPCSGTINGIENHPGFQMFEKIASRPGHPPIIVYSPFEMVHDHDWFLAHGATACIQKPKRIERIVRLAKEVLAKTNISHPH